MKFLEQVLILIKFMEQVLIFIKFLEQVLNTCINENFGTDIKFYENLCNRY